MDSKCASDEALPTSRPDTSITYASGGATERAGCTSQSHAQTLATSNSPKWFVAPRIAIVTPVTIVCTSSPWLTNRTRPESSSSTSVSPSEVMLSNGFSGPEMPRYSENSSNTEVCQHEHFSQNFQQEELRVGKECYNPIR